jgi:hypothetical protein
LPDANPSAASSPSQSANPQTPQFVNTWKPVTDLYIEHETAGAITAPVIVEPPKPTPGPVSAPDPSYNTVPFSLNIITGFYFFQTVMYFVLAGPLLTNPQSAFSQWIVVNYPSFIPFTITRRHPEIFTKLVGEAFMVMAAISLWVSILWVFRSWKIRWVTMAYAGGRVLRRCVYLFAGVASGVGSGLSPASQTIVIFSCCIDALIFGYLAFYPGVKQAFEKTY